MCKKTSDLVEDGFPYADHYRESDKYAGVWLNVSFLNGPTTFPGASGEAHISDSKTCVFNINGKLSLIAFCSCICDKLSLSILFQCNVTRYNDDKQDTKQAKVIDQREL